MSIKVVLSMITGEDQFKHSLHYCLGSLLRKKNIFIKRNKNKKNRCLQFGDLDVREKKYTQKKTQI